jgi:carbon-monoxide dehydrogenase large subunit
MIVNGQIQGGIVNAIGQALYEEVVYGEDGQLRTGTLVDYMIPTAADLPTFEMAETVTPSPTNPMGVKGVGEAGTIAASPAVINAIVDALRPFGVKDVDMPATPQKLWQLMSKNGGRKER